MSFCLFHDCLSMLCHGPHCPKCGAPEYHGSECIVFVKRERVDRIQARAEAEQ